MVYVYLDTINNRLLISRTKMDNKVYFEFMNTDNDISGEAICKTFCAGYIIGSKNKTPINDIMEFR